MLICTNKNQLIGYVIGGDDEIQKKTVKNLLINTNINMVVNMNIKIDAEVLFWS